MQGAGVGQGATAFILSSSPARRMNLLAQREPIYVTDSFEAGVASGEQLWARSIWRSAFSQPVEAAVARDKVRQESAGEEVFCGPDFLREDVEAIWWDDVGVGGEFVAVFLGDRERVEG